MEFNETWQEARSRRPLQSLFFFFRTDRKNKMVALASDMLRHFRLLLRNHWTEFNETWQEARSQGPLPSLCFSGRSKKNKQTRWPPCPLIGWDIFDFSSETAERNSTKLDRKLDLNVLYQIRVCFFCFFFFFADLKNKMVALASDWLRHFWLLLWNRLTEFNETWQEARSQCPLPSMSFSCRSVKQDGRPGFWLVETFSTSPLKPLIGFKATWQEARSQHPLPSWSVSGRSVNKKGRPGQLRCTICGPFGLLFFFILSSGFGGKK